jgi:hypothetical protein
MGIRLHGEWLGIMTRGAETSSFRAVALLSVPGAGLPTFINALFRHPEILPEKAYSTQYLPVVIHADTKNPPSIQWSAISRKNSSPSPLSKKKALRRLRNGESSRSLSCMVVRLPGALFPELDVIAFQLPDAERDDERLWDWVHTVPGIVQTMVILPADTCSEKKTLLGLTGLKGSSPLPIIALNKADHCPLEEFEDIRNTFLDNLIHLGWDMLPWTFLVSGTLEKGRIFPNQTLRSALPAMRDRLDIEFDRLRLALYEFDAESRRPSREKCNDYTALLASFPIRTT